MKRNSIKDIINKKNKTKITCLTSYSASLTKILDLYVDVILVGDSLGTVLYGMKNTQGVTMGMMMLHGKIISNYSNKAFTIVDMPYKTYTNKKEALKNSKKLINFTKCQSVKLETDFKHIDIVKYLTKNKIKVISHIGVTPQSYKNFNKITSKGKSLKEENELIELAIKLESAGSSMIVLECIKKEVAKKITNAIKIPTIGIGASKECDGQVLVIDDILNIEGLDKKPRFIKSYVNLNKSIKKAVKRFTLDVAEGKFPKNKNTY